MNGRNRWDTVSIDDTSILLERDVDIDAVTSMGDTELTRAIKKKTSTVLSSC